MANTKISALTAVPSVDGTEQIPLAKGGLNYKVTIAQIKSWIGNATSAVAGLMSASDKAKLDGIASAATANATNAQLRDRSTHTGTQAASTITGLASVATSGAYADLSGKPDLTLAALGAAPAGHVGTGGAAHAAASGTTAGFMSAAHYTMVANLRGVAATAPTDGQTLTWDNANSVWKPSTPGGSGNYTVTGFSKANTLTGTGQANGLLVTHSVFRVNDSAAGTRDALILPATGSMQNGTRITILNHTGNDLTIFPAVGGKFSSNAVNAGKTISSWSVFDCILMDSTINQWMDY